MAKNDVIYIILMKFFLWENDDRNEKNVISDDETDNPACFFESSMFFQIFIS